MNGRQTRRLIDWVYALVEQRDLSIPERIQGSSLMPMCTTHQDPTKVHPGNGCTCGKGTVRHFATNHSKSSLSRSFDSIRDAIGAVPWTRNGDIELIH